MPQELPAPALNMCTVDPVLICPLRRPSTLARHRVIESLITCIRPPAATCDQQVVFGPDAFCGLLLTPSAAGNAVALSAGRIVAGS